MNLVVYLEASEIAKSMYEQYGFKYIRPVEFDTRKFGGDHIKTDWVSEVAKPKELMLILMLGDDQAAAVE